MEAEDEVQVRGWADDLLTQTGGTGRRWEARGEGRMNGKQKIKETQAVHGWFLNHEWGSWPLFKIILNIYWRSYYGLLALRALSRLNQQSCDGSIILISIFQERRLRSRGNLSHVTQLAWSKSQGSHPGILTPETMTSTSPQCCPSARKDGELL